MKHPEGESLAHAIKRGSLNSFYRADIFCRKSERNAKLVVKKFELRHAKKTFGMDYMNLLEKEASQDDFEQCLRNGYEKIGVIHKDIRHLRAEKSSLDDLLKQKLVRKQGAPDHNDKVDHQAQGIEEKMQSGEGKHSEEKDGWHEDMQKKEGAESSQAKVVHQSDLSLVGNDVVAAPNEEVFVVVYPGASERDGDDEEDNGTRKASEISAGKTN